MKSIAISELMVKDHLKIVKLINDVEKNLNHGKSKIIKIFDKFVCNLEKHLFTEEKAIFTSYYKPTNTTELGQMITYLVKEHDEILEMVKDMKRSLIQSKDFDFLSLKKLLMNHKNFEDEKVYPRLDQELNELEKELIISRITEIILK